MSALVLNWPAEIIYNQLLALWSDVSVEVLPHIDSSNSELMQRARSGHMQPVLLVAERQSAGRGRMGRSWHSGAVGDALTFSLGLPLPPDGDLRGLSLVVGCSLCHSLDGQHQHGLRIKWPNDVWYQQRKLGGILVEVCISGAQRYAVVGVGLNLAQPPQFDTYAGNIACQITDKGGYPQSIQPQQPAWLRECLPSATAPAVLQQVALPLAQALHQFSSRGFAPWQQRFAARDALHDRPVWLSDGSQGIARGVDAGGALRVQVADQLREVISDEISVRPL